MNDKELTHWGVKGMKWGVRRSQAKLARIDRKAKRKNWSEDATTAAQIKTKKLKQMSNAELRKLNERLQLEQNYKDLTKKQTSKGRKVVNEIIAGAAKDTAKSYVSKYMKKGISAVGTIAKNRISDFGDQFDYTKGDY